MKILYAIALLAIGLLLPTFPLHAQDVNRDVIQNNIGKAVYEKFPDAAAIILYEKGTLEFSRNTKGYEQVYREHQIVKILKSSAFDIADVSHIYENSNGFSSYVGDVSGATYNIENGNVTKTQLHTTSIFHQKINESFFELKFVLPAVKEGSIIEYTYEIRSDVSIVAPSWRFQNEYPTLSSEYEIFSPPGFQYVYVTQATPPFKKCATLKDATPDSVTAYQVVTPAYNKGTSTLWGRKYVPAINFEPYISTEINHTERIDVQLSSFNPTGRTIDKHDVMNTWESFNARMHERYTKYYVGRNNFFTDSLQEIAKESSGTIEKARKIFSYIRSSYDCSDTIALMPHNDIEKVFKSRYGNAAELNLLLVAMLNKAGLEAFPVMLSTIGSLKSDPIYPLIDRFNHLVCLLKVDGKEYFLDASGKNNAFGYLPLYCYNGYARVISKDGSGVVLDTKKTKERNVYTVTLDSLTGDGYKIGVSYYMGIYHSRELRNMAKGDKDKIAQYIQMMFAGDEQGVMVQDIVNFDNQDTNLVVKFTTRETFKKRISKFYFALDYIKIFRDNPFVSMTRRLPIEFPSQSEEVYILRANLPEGVEPEELPKPALLTYEENKLLFKHIITYDEGSRTLTVNTKFQANDTVFPVEGYETIRKFFEKMIQEINHTVVLNIKG